MVDVALSWGGRTNSGLKEGSGQRTAAFAGSMTDGSVGSHTDQM